jgi:hypothetical protein
MKQKKCKQCKEAFIPLRPLQQVCSAICGVRLTQSQKEKKQRKETIQKKKELLTLSDHLKIAQATFNHWIRLRDEGLNCISCQKPPKKKNAGHYFNANNHYAVRFDEDNVHLQCEHCNTSLSANLIPYRKYLIEKIGIERFEVLESKAYLTRNFTIEEVKEINETYKRKIKELKQ